MKKIFAVAAIVGLVGCAPIIGKKVHTYKYESARAIHSHRRVLAVKHMYETCKGDYNVIYEGPTGKTTSHDAVVLNYNTKEWKVEFTCNK